MSDDVIKDSGASKSNTVATIDEQSATALGESVDLDHAAIADDVDSLVESLVSNTSGIVQLRRALITTLTTQQIT
ncbi:hypothetical protein [Colwellia sp. 20A7]|uniref:hypothetical protein n=1 Tax=Colwellia sp. 20A7 TaxID=2689569 RepID=UPI00135BF598|nr:hypothetical protein [Colwellia sp. 20A7]